MNVAERICHVQLRQGVEDADLTEELRFDLMEVVHEWAKGVVSEHLSLNDLTEIYDLLKLAVFTTDGDDECSRRSDRSVYPKTERSLSRCAQRSTNRWRSDFATENGGNFRRYQKRHCVCCQSVYFSC